MTVAYETPMWGVKLGVVVWCREGQAGDLSMGVTRVVIVW